MRFIRWRLIFSKLEKSIPIFDDFLNWMGSYTFTATPGKAGEGVRAILLKKKFGTSFSKTFAAIIFERIIDGISVIIIVFLNLSLLKVFAVEPEVFVQSTVNRASEILAKDISQEEKINNLKLIAKETVDIKGVGFYSLGSAR